MRRISRSRHCLRMIFALPTLTEEGLLREGVGVVCAQDKVRLRGILGAIRTNQSSELENCDDICDICVVVTVSVSFMVMK